MNLNVVDQNGKKLKEVAFAHDKIELPSLQVLTDYVKMFQDHMRPKTGSTKLRPEVSGGGIKPWRQKGTGRARAGSIRSPLWRGGAVIFGPKPRVSSVTMNRQAKREAMKAAVAMRIREEKALIVSEIKLGAPKTKEFKKFLTEIKVPVSTLVLVDGYQQALLLASRNIPRIQLLDWKDANAFEVMRFKNLVMTEGAYNQILNKYFAEDKAQ